MKIAILHPSLAVKGGAENVVIWLAAELARRGHRVTVFTTEYDDHFFGPRDQLPFSIVVRDLGGYDVNPVQFLKASWRLKGELAGFDWVNPHNFPAYHWAYIARILNPSVGPIVWFCEEPMRLFYPDVCNRHLLRLRGQGHERPVSGRPRWRRWVSDLRTWIHNWRWEVAKLLDRWVVPRLDAILTNSEFVAGQIRSIFRVEAVPCLLGIPLERFRPGPAVQMAPPRGRYLFTVSRLFPEKNLETVLEAIRILKDRGVLLFDRYIVAGDGPLKAELERRVKDLGLNGIVEFKGFVPEEDLADLYRQALLVIYLPLDETFGLVFPEAALWKKPVIGPNHGGPAEIVQDEVTGLQVDPTDPHAIAERIDYCLRNPSLLADFGEAGHRYATTELTISRFVDRFERLLHDRGRHRLFRTYGYFARRRGVKGDAYETDRQTAGDGL